MSKLFKGLLLIILLIFLSCRTYKDNLKSFGGKNEAIQNAILDFVNTNRLFQKDSVFRVSFKDTLYNYVLDTVGEGRFKWAKGRRINGVVTVSISANYNVMLITDSTEIGTVGNLPSRCIIKNGSLFYWWDDDYPLDKSTLVVLRRYGLIEEDLYSTLEYNVDDSKKGVDYYFCRNDLTNYKKVTGNKGIGYYRAPTMTCN